MRRAGAGPEPPGGAVPRLARAGLVAMLACATLPAEVARQPSSAWEHPGETRLGRALARELERHPGISGFWLLGSGADAFVARMALAEAAERTLDLQYYIFRGDLTGRLILDGLLRAADRGVRVRLLLDDTAARGKDAVLAGLASHPAVEVRLFNPSAGRSPASWMVGAAADLERINHRMHNKMFVADNAVGVVGGRNVGDEYFGAREGVNFADLDLLAAGPVVQDLSRSFDDFWNSAWAYPIEALHPERPDPAALGRAREELAAHRAMARDSPYARRLRESDLLARLDRGDLPLVWAPARVVCDRPEKAGGEGRPADAVRLGPQLRSAVPAPRSELLVASPYFIPGERGMAAFRRLREQGVRIRIVTNSFASNDVALVHGGYAPYRKGLLRAGVELHELRPSLADAPEEDRERIGSSGVSLHAKTFVVDRERVFVGSLNLDPRSLDLNTELGFVVESRELAEQLARRFDALLGPAYTYRLELDPSGEDLVWVTEERGRRVLHHRDPEVGCWRRFSTWFLSIFAPESML